MDLNFLLSQEQLAMMRAKLSMNAADYGVHVGTLSVLAPLIQATGFPHRPYWSRGARQSWRITAGNDS